MIPNQLLQLKMHSGTGPLGNMPCTKNAVLIWDITLMLMDYSTSHAAILPVMIFVITFNAGLMHVLMDAHATLFEMARHHPNEG